MDIPEDVEIQILVRLPVRTLLKFRCVCKAWCGLIGSRGFVDLHLEHGRQDEYLVLKHFDTKDDNTILSFYCREQDGAFRKTAPDWKDFPPRTRSISGACNGICLIGETECNIIGCHDFHEHPLYLCNPATREIRKLPDRPFGRHRARPPIECYTPPFHACQRVGLGFGYDPRANEYKVVSVMQFHDDDASWGQRLGTFMIEIYDLSSNSWRVADTIFPTVDEDHGQIYPMDLNFAFAGTIFDLTCGLFFNESIHWNATDHEVILALDISDEVMRAIQLPRATFATPSNNSGNTVFVLEDSLAFVQRSAPDFSIDIWVMMDYGDEESWIKKFSVGPEPGMIVLGYWNDGLLICETREGEFCSYNLLEDDPELRDHPHIRRLDNEGKWFHRWSLGAIVMRGESLVHLT